MKLWKTEFEAITGGWSKAMDDTNVQDPRGQMRRCPKGQRLNVKTGSCDDIWASKPRFNQQFSAGSSTRRCSRGQTFDASLGECKWPQDSRQQWKQQVWSRPYFLDATFFSRLSHQVWGNGYRMIISTSLTLADKSAFEVWFGERMPKGSSFQCRCRTLCLDEPQEVAGAPRLETDVLFDIMRKRSDI